MKIKTTRFGEIELPDDSVISFPEGIIGFQDAQSFVIMDCGEDGILKWLQCVEKPELAFIICEASLIVPDYQIVIGSKETGLLQLDDTSDAAVCLIMVIPEDPAEATANLLGPIVMNSQTRLGMQMILVNPNYSTKQKIFQKKDPEASATDEEAHNAGA